MVSTAMAAERNARWPSRCIFPVAGHFKLKREPIKEVDPAAMEQKMLVYSFVAQGTLILAETDELISNLATIAAKHLQIMSPAQSMFSYSEDGYSFNFLARDGFGIIVPLPLFLYTFMISFFIFLFSAPSLFRRCSGVHWEGGSLWLSGEDSKWF